MVQNTNVGTLYGNASEFVASLREVEPVFNETYLTCKWRNNLATCESFFHDFLTEEGICYTFNSPDQTDIYREEA